MGNSLDKPVDEKTTEFGRINIIPHDSKNQNDINYLDYGVSSMQGWRTSMEDCHIVNSGIFLRTDDDNTTIQATVLAVLDGHGGPFAANYIAQKLCACLSNQKIFSESSKQVSNENISVKKKKGKKRSQNKNASKKKNIDVQLLKESVYAAFCEMDKDLMNELILIDNSQTQSKFQYKKNIIDTEYTHEDPNLGENQNNDYDLWDTGTTATVVIITPTIILCANVGDSRTILCQGYQGRNGSKAVPMSHDHKPDVPEEAHRIIEAGGKIISGLIDGELAVSRGFGDFNFKDRDVLLNTSTTISEDRIVFKVISTPDIMIHHRNEVSDQYLVLACDGIWDVLSNDQCIDIISELFSVGENNLGLLCEEVLDICLKKGSRDNMTIIVVKMPAQIIGKGGGVTKRRKERARIKGN